MLRTLPRSAWWTAVALTAAALVVMLTVTQLRADAAGVTIPDEDLELVADLVVTQDGAVIEGLHVVGDIEVAANDVTIRQVRVTSDDPIPVRVSRDARGLLVEDATITCDPNTGLYGIGNDHYTANRVELVTCPLGFRDGVDVSITDSLVDGAPIGETTAGSGDTTTTAPPTTEAPAAGDLFFSTSGDRSNPAALEGATVPGEIRIFLETDLAGVEYVAWYLDGVLFRDDDLAAPWDMAPAAQGNSGAVDVASLGDGGHLATAVLHMADGSERTVNARFVLELSGDSSTDPAPTEPPSASEPPSTTEAPTSGASDDASWPDASNTGVQDGVQLTPSGSITVRQDGAVIENLDVDGRIEVRADNVTIRNVRVTGDSAHLIRNRGRNLLVEDVTLVGQQPCSAGIAFSNYTARRVDVSGCADGMKANGNVLIEDNYIHDLRKWAGTHNDGIQSTGGSNIVIRDNRIEGAFRGSVSAIKLTSEHNHLSDVVVEGNLFSGGNYTIYLTRKDDMQAPTDIRIVDNTFVRGTEKWGWLYNDNGPSQVFSGNVWDDGTPVG
ncbi:MAG: right-handed parallel beta-helix repeat-containing protein [Actinomycetota bacterium]